MHCMPTLNYFIINIDCITNLLNSELGSISIDIFDENKLSSLGLEPKRYIHIM